MYTVIIAEKKHFDAIEKNKLYFKPFLDRLNEDFAFCEWIPGGKTFYDCVPDLIRTVGRNKTWRAVILKDDSLSEFQNPYDAISYQRIVECEEKNRLTNPMDDADDTDSVSSADSFVAGNMSIAPVRFEEWKEECTERVKAMLSEKTEIFKEAMTFPLQRLATCFCFVPDDAINKRVVTRKEIGDYVNDKLDANNFEKLLSELEHYYHIEQDRIKNIVRKECIEEMLPGDGILKRKGSMGIALPSEVYCLAERTTETGFFSPDVYWENHTGLEYSGFVGRNMYFDKMRFVVSDILPKTHQNYRYDRIRFLYNLLLLSSNDVPSGAVHPRKLYCLESENNEEALIDIVSAYINKLDNTIDVVDGQIEKIKREVPEELDDSDAEKLFCAKVIVPVSSNAEYSEEIYADQKDYGYFSDSYGNELDTWKSQHEKTKEAVEKMVKQPRRALKKAVDKLDRECDVDSSMIRALNSFQMDDVREHTEAEKDKMVSMETTNIFDLSRYKKELDDENKKVMSEINRRMKKKTTFALGLVCVLLLFITILPLILTNRGNLDSQFTALILGVASSALLAIVFVVTVFFLRMPLRKAINDYNQKSKDIENDVFDAMRKYSNYISVVCNIRRGYRVLEFSSNNIDKYDRSLRIRKKHKNDMEKIRAYIMENYGDFVAVGRDEDEFSVIPYDYDFAREKVEYEYYPPYLPENRVYIDYLEAGNKIAVPTDFVSKVTLRMEEIYD